MKIVLCRPDRWLMFDKNRRIVPEEIAPDGTPVFFSQDLPLEDQHGRPVFAFLVDAERIWAWVGEPIELTDEIKKALEKSE